MEYDHSDNFSFVQEPNEIDIQEFRIAIIDSGRTECKFCKLRKLEEIEAL